MPQEYRKNHTASVCYLAGFEGSNGRVQVEYLRTSRQAPARPTAIGFINDFWGMDEALRKRAEERASEIEAAASPVLSTLPDEWPLEHESEERLAVLRFVALHLVRSPRWRAQLDALAERSIATRRAEWKEALGGSFDRFLERLRADDFMVDLMFGQVQTMSSLLGSLHWTLLRFPRPMLATSDQPVVPIPLLAPRAVVPIPPQLTNLVGNIEFRVAISPDHALMMCWHDAEHATMPVDLGFKEAVDLNAAVRAHANAQVYWQPGSRPPWISPPEAQPTSRPISTAVYDGYRTATAIRSRRIRETRAILEEMIEDQVHSEVRTLKVVERKRAA